MWRRYVDSGSAYRLSIGIEIIIDISGFLRMPV
jgi:hypothetical protein